MRINFVQNKLDEILNEIESDLDDVWDNRDYPDTEKRRLSKNLKQKRRYKKIKIPLKTL